MYAIIQIGSKQYRVRKGDVIHVDCVDVQPGQEVDLGDVLCISEESGTVRVGRPTVEGCKVRAQYVADVKGPKVSSVKYKKRKNEYRKFGHRQSYSQMKILDIQM
jgi:large subunit ribosomal protein L21